jgi:integrase
MVAWYVRRGRGPCIRIRGAYGSHEFEEAYLAAVAGAIAPSKRKSAAGTLLWLIERYKESSAWSKLSPATKGQRANTYRRVCKTAGEEPFSAINKKTIIAGRDRRKATPFAANDFLKTMRGLFQWAVASEFLEVDPTNGVKGFGNKTEGHHTWTEDEVERFEARWPIGTRERLAFAILLYTGLRRGDAAVLGRQHVRDGVITLRTEKTNTVVVIPILPALAEVIAASKTGTLAFIATQSGVPMTRKGFGNWFKGACRAAGVPGTAHGLRKAGATRAANNGATEAELEAIFGWRGGHMASLYTRAANRARLAKSGIAKLGQGENIYATTQAKGGSNRAKNETKSNV